MKTVPYENTRSFLIYASLLFIIPVLGLVFMFSGQAIIFITSLLVVTITFGAILIHPYFGILLLGILIPLENLQILPGVGLTASKIIGIVILASTFLHILTGKMKGFRQTPIDLPLLGFLGICILSLIPARDKITGIEKVVSLFSYVVVFYLAGNLINTQKRLFSITMVLFLSLVSVSLINILQAYGINLGVSLESHVTWVGSKRVVRYAGSFLNVNRFATIQIIGIAIVLGLFRIPSYRLKFLLFAGLIVIIYSLYFSYSRSAYLAVVFMFMLYSFLYFRKKTLYTLIILFTIPFLIYSFLPEDMYEHLQSGFTLEDASMEMRLQQYKAAIDIFKKNWLIGVGIGNQSQILIGTQVGYDLLETGLHSLPFSILLETGILGFAAFCWLVTSGWLYLYRSFQNTKDDLFRCVFIVGLLSLPGYLIHNLFHNFMYLSIIGMTGGILNAAFLLNSSSPNPTECIDSLISEDNSPFTKIY